jgi:hypothetical protein
MVCYRSNLCSKTHFGWFAKQENLLPTPRIKPSSSISSPHYSRYTKIYSSYQGRHKQAFMKAEGSTEEKQQKARNKEAKGYKEEEGRKWMWICKGGQRQLKRCCRYSVDSAVVISGSELTGEATVEDFVEWILLFIVCNLREGDHLEDPGVDGRIILKWTCERLDGGHGLDQSGSG